MRASLPPLDTQHPLASLSQHPRRGKRQRLAATILLGASLTASLPCYALQQPTRLASDNRIETVAYSANNVVPIQGTTFTTTQITFGKTERILNVQIGDLGAWTSAIDEQLPYMLFLKPTTYDSNTNLTVITDAHTYYFHLSSNPAQSEARPNKTEATYAVHFIYPEQEMAAIASIRDNQAKQQAAELSAFQQPRDYQWNYSFAGDKRIVPVHIFDDGKWTYLQLQPNQPIPAVFAVDNPDGKESVVNSREEGQYLVIQRVAPQFTLRVGNNVVASIFNNTAIAALRHH